MSESDYKTVLQIDHTSLVTSIAFINICFALIFYLRGSKPPFGEEACNILVHILILIYTSFLVCAMFTYADMITKSYMQINEIVNIRCVSYIVGIIGFTLVTTILLIQR